MTAVERLLQRYRAQLALPWSGSLSPTERVWVAVYDPADERRLRAALPSFELATRQAGWTWHALDLTAAFAEWMAAHPYREAYFAEPELLAGSLSAFEEALALRVRQTLEAAEPRSVVGVVGAGSLYGLTRVSRLMERTSPALRGRMLLFFPGRVEGHNYRMFGARDGWNYHSIPLTP
ncbi:BREX protein BrxB domain-containing protein [Deinococcus murrayi]|uniref:BREX protein BrxB domain-containing protein n=1 Tax=Deinococcus murrayi TaxID=68910 RepID=UPI000484AC5D|nr:BREX protein BrxB domain-containing protein [Deinococcus murrayi]